jgi:hypothetical protein
MLHFTVHNYTVYTLTSSTAYANAKFNHKGLILQQELLSTIKPAGFLNSVRLAMFWPQSRKCEVKRANYIPEK